jgi:uncharacterized MAPEG superfamily protein
MDSPMISIYCVIVSFIMPMICSVYAKLSQKGYDNRSPREFLAKLEGKGKRANYAQSNSWEAFAPFGIGVLTAHYFGAPHHSINVLGLLFIIARCAYCYFYITDQHIPRSTAWFIGFASTVTLYLIGL